ncbi:MAG: hypothetical protein HY682_04210 [Chloroflexi bacterium]|nr:hypothetical protein [Chloroflexota bacterium]
MVTHFTRFQGVRIKWTDIRALERVATRNSHFLRQWLPAPVESVRAGHTRGTLTVSPSRDWRATSCRKCQARAVAGPNDMWVEDSLLHTCPAVAEQQVVEAGGATADLPVR